jgi:hypothetical protein
LIQQQDNGDLKKQLSLAAGVLYQGLLRRSTRVFAALRRSCKCFIDTLCCMTEEHAREMESLRNAHSEQVDSLKSRLHSTEDQLQVCVVRTDYLLEFIKIHAHFLITYSLCAGYG